MDPLLTALDQQGKQLAEYERVSLSLADIQAEFHEKELRAAGMHPDQLQTAFEILLVKVAFVVLVVVLTCMYLAWG